MLDALRQGRLAIVGDLMLDQYVYGEVSRISPEAPVPVLQAQSERAAPGAAANVAANVAALGGRVLLVGAVGSDAAGVELCRLIAGQERLQLEPVVAPQRPTTLKTRLVCGQQQIVRVDRETTAPYTPAEQEALTEAALGALAEADVLVLSDYGKGVLCDRVLEAVLAGARAAGKPVVVDPKRRRFEAYRGADYITPNRKELSDATGLPCETDEEAALAAQAAAAQCGAAILLTRSARGVSLFREGAAPVHIPARTREVFDVSGAGDTVVAAFALALAGGVEAAQAVMLANAAAGVVVGKRGTAVCSAAELAQALEGREGRCGPYAGQGAASLEQAQALCAEWREAGLRIGFANGCFDLLHPGHVALLTAAAQACDRLVVALNSDASVRRLKGASRPVQGQDARAAVVGAVKGVDAVVLFEEDTPLRLIQALAPDVLIKGADYREEDVVGAEVVKARGGRVLLVELEPGHSTTALVARAHAP
jgi:D-beta-D-heptose 7-phosphate kinase/D-beta-D-heptose 1-phosphate adenosyltransferase